MTSIRLPTPLRPYAGGQSSVTVDCATVADALAALTRHYPQLQRHLYAESGELRAFVNVYVNDANIRDLQGAQTLVTAGDTVLIVPSIAGGAA